MGSVRRQGRHTATLQLALFAKDLSYRPHIGFNGSGDIARLRRLPRTKHPSRLEWAQCTAAAQFIFDVRETELFCTLNCICVNVYFLFLSPLLIAERFPERAFSSFFLSFGIRDWQNVSTFAFWSEPLLYIVDFHQVSVKIHFCPSLQVATGLRCQLLLFL